jgi:subtilase family serine protease
VPKSSRELPGDIGHRFHTHILIAGSGPVHAFSETPSQSGAPPFPGYFFETPASLACIYNLVHQQSASCNPNVVNTNPAGGAKAIAVVDAYDDPNAASDLANFDTQFGIATANFSVVYASGTKPIVDPTGGWELEASLDIEYAHAMAPNAQLFLVEAASDGTMDLLNAVTVAAGLVAGAGGGEVSNSWGGSEFPGETYMDSVFEKAGVVFFASAGDSPGTEWPSASPNAVAVGGTSTNRNPTTGNLLYEGAWNQSGGGLSEYETRPGYQNSIADIAGSARAVPDVAADANPITPVWVLDTNLYEGEPGGWFTVGGTSLAAPLMAGIVNAAGHFHVSSGDELETIYYNWSKALVFGFNDIKTDNCGPYGGYVSVVGYDFCTGVGSPHAYSGK